MNLPSYLLENGHHVNGVVLGSPHTPNYTSSLVAGDMAGAMNPGGQGGSPGGLNNGNPPAGQPPATEYTLQGVMRFLQTEWHRHERDRNAWEIEKQEMKGRIANLEGAARRADATQKALKKYVAILESKVKDQAAQLKAAAGGTQMEDQGAKPKKVDREELIQAKLRCESFPRPVPNIVHPSI
jgi:striatin 1/3/4